MQTPSADLVLQGTVIDIAPLPHAGGAARWRVTIAVERVISGEFAGKTFEFAVHSPTKSGLATGGVRTVRALRTPGGYSVDPWQWLPR
jgi:hypothetical protein